MKVIRWGKCQRINGKSCPLIVHNIAKPSTDNALFNGQRIICPALISRPHLWYIFNDLLFAGNSGLRCWRNSSRSWRPTTSQSWSELRALSEVYLCHLERIPDPSVLNDFSFILERTTAAFFVIVRLLSVPTNIGHRFNTKSMLPSCIPLLTGEPYFHDVPMRKIFCL